jgi:hypothetical protein
MLKIYLVRAGLASPPLIRFRRTRQETFNIQHPTLNIEFQNKSGVLIVAGRWVGIADAKNHQPRRVPKTSHEFSGRESIGKIFADN